MKRLINFLLIIWVSFSLGFSAHAEEKSIQEAKKTIFIVANQSNPLDKLSLSQVKQIFLGRLRRFPGVGTDMSVADREDSSKVYYHFYQKIVRMDPSRLKRYRARYLFSGQGRLPETKMSQDAMMAFVQKQESAIGYIELAEGDSIPFGMKVLYQHEW